MIPWFVTRFLARLGRLFGYEMWSRATIGRPGADSVHFVRPGGIVELRVAKHSDMADGYQVKD